MDKSCLLNTTYPPPYPAGPARRKGICIIETSLRLFDELLECDGTCANLIKFRNGKYPIINKITFLQQKPSPTNCLELCSGASPAYLVLVDAGCFFVNVVHVCVVCLATETVKGRSETITALQAVCPPRKYVQGSL